MTVADSLPLGRRKDTIPNYSATLKCVSSLPIERRTALACITKRSGSGATVKYGFMAWSLTDPAAFAGRPAFRYVRQS